MISASIYTLITLANASLLPVYWNLHEHVRNINTYLQLLSGVEIGIEESIEISLNLEFNKLQDYLLVCMLFTMILVMVWLLFCISQRTALNGTYVFVLLATSIMGIVMVNELEYSHELLEELGEEDNLTCEDFMEEIDANKLVEYIYCQDSWVYVLYYCFYGSMTMIACLVLGTTLRRNHNSSGDGSAF